MGVFNVGLGNYTRVPVGLPPSTSEGPAAKEEPDADDWSDGELTEQFNQSFALRLLHEGAGAVAGAGDSQPRDTLEQEFGDVYEEPAEDVATCDPYL